MLGKNQSSGDAPAAAREHMQPYFSPAFDGKRWEGSASFGDGNESASFEGQDLLGAMFGAGPAQHLGSYQGPSTSTTFAGQGWHNVQIDQAGPRPTAPHAAHHEATNSTNTNSDQWRQMAPIPIAPHAAQLVHAPSPYQFLCAANQNLWAPQLWAPQQTFMPGFTHLSQDTPSLSQGPMLAANRASELERMLGCKKLGQAIYNFWKEQEFSGNLKKSEDGKSYILNEIGSQGEIRFWARFNDAVFNVVYGRRVRGSIMLMALKVAMNLVHQRAEEEKRDFHDGIDVLWVADSFEEKSEARKRKRGRPSLSSQDKLPGSCFRLPPSLVCAACKVLRWRCGPQCAFSDPAKGMYLVETESRRKLADYLKRKRDSGEVIGKRAISAWMAKIRTDESKFDDPSLSLAHQKLFGARVVTFDATTGRIRGDSRMTQHFSGVFAFPTGLGELPMKCVAEELSERLKPDEVVPENGRSRSCRRYSLPTAAAATNDGCRSPQMRYRGAMREMPMLDSAIALACSIVQKHEIVTTDAYTFSNAALVRCPTVSSEHCTSSLLADAGTVLSPLSGSAWVVLVQRKDSCEDEQSQMNFSDRAIRFKVHRGGLWGLASKAHARGSDVFFLLADQVLHTADQRQEKKVEDAEEQTSSVDEDYAEETKADEAAALHEGGAEPSGDDWLNGAHWMLSLVYSSKNARDGDA